MDNELQMNDFEKKYEKANLLLLADGDLHGALSAFKDCLEISKTEVDLVFVLPKLVLICERLGDQDSVIRYAGALLSAEEKIHKTERQSTLVSLGMAFRKRGHLDMAIDYLKRALVAAPPRSILDDFWSHQNLALAYDVLGDSSATFAHLYAAGAVIDECPPEHKEVFVHVLSDSLLEIIGPKAKNDDPSHLVPIVAQIRSGDLSRLVFKLKNSGFTDSVLDSVANFVDRVEKQLASM